MGHVLSLAYNNIFFSFFFPLLHFHRPVRQEPKNPMLLQAVLLKKRFFFVFPANGKLSHKVRQNRDVIYQTRERVFHQDIQTPRSGLKKRGAAEFF